MADAATLRKDVAAFAEYIERPFSDRQAADLRRVAERRFSAIVGPRQSGKSRSLAVYALWRAMRKAGQRVLIVSAGDMAAKRLLSEVRMVVSSNEALRGAAIEEQAALVRLSNGSEIRSVPASEAQIRGWSVDALILDEAQLLPQDLIVSAALPTVAARPEALVIFAGTAGRAQGSFYDAVVRGDQHSDFHQTFRWSVDECPWITPSAVAAMRESMSPARFAAEMLGEFQSGSDALFSKELLDRATADYVPGTLQSLRGPARVLAGVDWGAVHDRSALVAVARLPYVATDLPMFGVALAHRWQEGAPLPDVVSDIVDAPAHWGFLVPERNGIGESATQTLLRAMARRPGNAGGARRNRLRLVDATRFEQRTRQRDPRPARRDWHARVLPHMTSAQSKGAMYGDLAMLLHRGQIVLSSSDTELLRELLFLRVELTAGGNERVEAATDEGSGHDDLSDALALALAPHKLRDGRWTTLVGRCAELDSPRPEPPPSTLRRPSGP
ncbi:hypothetical protein SK069_14260 [Patulibacter brassicae]|uniref:AAA family ATPase n=1 Tax=Patulibacter brassicae TaxID=1705717 RepID=A0ABU4VLR2_9ACTN|nr:terminase family protein [Patulibacter brassicae]MDX8152767.1 hypothetical protein [Patulibacter brassicae]